jgi:hypothetical protein
MNCHDTAVDSASDYDARKVTKIFLIHIWKGEHDLLVRNPNHIGWSDDDDDGDDDNEDKTTTPPL